MDNRQFESIAGPAALARADQRDPASLKTRVPIRTLMCRATSISRTSATS
jgi:hypothetical protein